MSQPAALGSLCHEVESSWGESTNTYTTLKHPLIGQFDLNLTHEKVDPAGIFEYRNQGSAYILGGIGGSFTARYHLYGHGATMVGSPSIAAFETYLGSIWGGTVALSATSSTTITGGTANIPTTTASGTFSAGSLVSVGAAGDTDGEGQVFPIATHTAQNMTLLSDLNGAPVNGAVLRPVVMLFPNSAPTGNAITGTRFRWQTANMQYAMHGCYPQSIELSGLGPGQIPQIAVTWGVSWWEHLAVGSHAFPNTVTSAFLLPATNARGSLHVQTVGTATRNVRTLCRDFTLNYQLGIVPLAGYSGVNQYQSNVGAVRTNDVITGSWTEDADANTTTPVLPGFGTGTDNKSIMLTLNSTDSKQVSVWLPNCCITNVPVQRMDGVNRFTIEFRAHTTATTTSALTLAPFILGFS